MSLKQFIIALLACVSLSQVGLRCARAEPSYEVSLEDEFGNSLQKFQQRGQAFAMGRMGQRYNLRVTNRTARRVEAVVSVDGRDVLSGKPGDYKGQRGYLVPAWGSVLIEGFRTSLSEVAAFRFTSPGDSYSSRMGSPENVGVIGAAFFAEAAPPPPRPVYRVPHRPYPTEGYKRGDYDGAGVGGSGRSSRAESRESPAAAPAVRSRGAHAPQADESASNIGTQYGEQTSSEVVEVSFQRRNAQRPDQLLVVRYDDRAGLEARGIRTWPQPEQQRHVERVPSAFPVNRFAPPPPPYPYYN